MGKIKDDDIPRLANLYHAYGQTFEQLALDYGCSPSTMRRTLVEGGHVTPRDTGQREGTQPKNRSNAPDPTDQARVPTGNATIPGIGAKSRLARRMARG